MLTLDLVCGLVKMVIMRLFWHTVTLVLLKCHFPTFFPISKLSGVRDNLAHLICQYCVFAGWRSREIDPNWQWVRRQATDSTRGGNVSITAAENSPIFA